MVEDDADLSSAVAAQLQKEGYVTDICDNGNDVELFLQNEEYDLTLFCRSAYSMEYIAVRCILAYN